MKRNWKLMVCLLMAMLMLTACSGKPDPEEFPDITQAIGPTATPTAVPTAETAADPEFPDASGESIFSENPYLEDEFTEEDVLAEEDYIDPEYGVLDNYIAMDTSATVYPYAGSTPIPLNPVDMPTPTPRPPVTFSYVSYTAGSLGLTFEAPSGWIADDSLTEVYSVIEPAEQMMGGQQCVVTIVAVPVNTNYDQRDLEKEVKARLNDISATNFAVWEPSLTATRHLMGGKGVYANYSGELVNGVKLGGRIHYVCINNMLYGVEIMYPREYREDYMNIFDKIRDSLKTI